MTYKVYALRYWESKMKNGAPDKVRTRDPLITNQVLYQLSYKGGRGRNSRFSASVKRKSMGRVRFVAGRKMRGSQNRIHAAMVPVWLNVASLRLAHQFQRFAAVFQRPVECPVCLHVERQRCAVIAHQDDAETFQCPPDELHVLDLGRAVTIR